MGRRYRRGDFRQALSIDELRAHARRRLPAFAFEFLDGGAEDERALRWNRAVFDTVRLVPRTLVGVADRHTRAPLLGREAAMPLAIAPTGFNGLYRPDADLALAAAAADAGVPFALSTVSNVRLERVAREAGGRLWLQLYVLKDRDATRDLVGRAERAGCEALVVTSDATVFGNREWDRRHYVTPGRLRWPSRIECLRHPRWLARLARSGLPAFANVADYLPDALRGDRDRALRGVPELFDRGLRWDDLAALRELWPRKLLLKGVLRREDAERTAALGCDGVVLSNHGGRQLDAAVAPLEVLPEIADALGGRLEILVDSGFRRGGDVVKAYALGAHGVLAGRAPLYGVAAGGQAGARHALAILAGEMERTLGQLGCRTFAEVGRDLLQSPLYPAASPAGAPTHRPGGTP